MLFKIIPGHFFKSNTLEQLKFKLEKIIGIYKYTGEVRKIRIAAQTVQKRNHIATEAS